MVFWGASLLLTFYLWCRNPYRSLAQAYLNSDFLWVTVIPYTISKIGKYSAAYVDDEIGLIFDRPTGKVLYLNVKGEVGKEFDFKNFSGKLKTFINPGGVKEYTAYASSRKDGQSILLGAGLITGTIAWSYLVRFMDISKPLPDIPRHETTRHLDPVTKAYDEKIGRDPHYWAKYKSKEFNKIQNEEYKKAEGWVEERKQLLNEKGIDDLDFLNELINPTLSVPD